MVTDLNIYWILFYSKKSCNKLFLTQGFGAAFTILNHSKISHPNASNSVWHCCTRTVWYHKVKEAQGMPCIQTKINPVSVCTFCCTSCETLMPGWRWWPSGNGKAYGSSRQHLHPHAVAAKKRAMRSMYTHKALARKMHSGWPLQ